ncbi:putative HTH-type transcriptional regulator Rv0880 [Massilia sp. Bi118]|uniref:MarR family winged helix-turn-helix transcriptional regulator n=1 Tax=Massilia sp. Bi118 TaxID=2822346 RepID=UPI001D46A0DD|nr:MarR family transcriptional regulator [Massilia sp. Bi118]CAH0141424.1 putative HTH-type transcriptional regulator Rv0880 [Massilia sp. Bi118]
MKTRKPDRSLQVAEDLRDAIKLLMREIRRDAERHTSGLSLMQAMLLGAVGHQPGIGVAELARMKQVRTPTMSAQVKALEEAGLLARAAPDPEDRRRSGLRLTEAGQAMHNQLHAQRLDWLVQRVGRLDDAQLDALAAAIEPLKLIARP